MARLGDGILSDILNVLFDPGLWLVCHIFLRGGFKYKVRRLFCSCSCRPSANQPVTSQSIEEIWNTQDHELVINNDMLDQALWVSPISGPNAANRADVTDRFVQGDKGGRHLQLDKPILTTNMSEMLRLTATNAGLPASSFYSIRRESGSFVRPTVVRR
jgi:hypothetical protein